MKYIKAALWLICLVGITVLFNISFGMLYTPDGMKGAAALSNIIASWVYLLFWVGLSVIAGAFKNKSILIAGIIYSSLPFVSLLGIPFLGTRLAYIVLILFYWGVPLQGISSALVYFQLPIFLLGYIGLSTILKSHFGIGTKKHQVESIH